MDKDNLINKIIFNKYKITKKIGEGSFGRIYHCVCIVTNETYALKIEPKNEGQNLLEFEACILCYLKGYGIPQAKSYGLSGNNNVLVMQLLGRSLEDLLKINGNKFSLKTVCMLADQMLDRVEYIHNNHIIHRDIKPDNFMTGEENKSLIFLIDFGLATKYRSSRTLEHNPMKDNKKLTGTARYASINALMGLEQSRRDDLEAIGYVLVYFLKGTLPWQGLKVTKEENRYNKIYEKKKETSPEKLCKELPPEFTEYVRYTRNLKYDQDPDYNFMRSLFRKVMEENEFEYDLRFDWIKDNDRDQSTNLTSNRNINKVNIGESPWAAKKQDHNRKFSELTLGMKQNLKVIENEKEDEAQEAHQSNLINDNYEANHTNQGVGREKSRLSLKEKETVNQIETDQARLDRDKIKKKKAENRCCFA